MADWDIRDLEKMEQARKRMLKTAPRMAFGVVFGLLLLWLATGFYVVGPGEQGIIRQFGKEIAATEPGLRYHWPWPVQQANVVSIEQIQRAEIGFRSFQNRSNSVTRRVPAEALMLTGDANIVEAQVIVQYRIKNPSQYLFRLRDPDQNLRTVTEVALRAAVGNATIDEVLTVGRAKVQDETKILLQELLDDYQSGLLVTEVRLQVVDPPDQVKDAFNEVVRAREDLERLVNQARGYKEDLLPKARGEAQRIIRSAEAYGQERVLRAQGDADRFSALLKEYQKAPRVTRDRLYLETIGKLLPRVQKIILSSQTGAVPVLPLDPQGTADALQKVMRSRGGAR